MKRAIAAQFNQTITLEESEILRLAIDLIREKCDLQNATIVDSNGDLLQTVEYLTNDGMSLRDVNRGPASESQKEAHQAIQLLTRLKF